MNITAAKFLESNPSFTTCPSPHMPEYAFIGRSNVGKSSLINAMTNRNSLAKTSSTPGKTQLINHFLINENWYLVDLPGYGWAKVSKSKRLDFEGLITEYLSERKNLVVTFVLIDIRHEPQAIDLEFLEWLGENQIPFAIVFTKADKLNNSKMVASLARYEEVLKSRWEALPPHFITSAVKNEGTEEILTYIEQYNEALEEKFSKIQPIKVTKEELPQPQKAVIQRKKYSQQKPYKKEGEENELNEFEKTSFDKNAPKPSKYAAPRKTNSKYTVPFSDDDASSKPVSKPPFKFDKNQNKGRNSSKGKKSGVKKDDFSKNTKSESKTGKSYPKKDFGKGDFSKDSRTDSKPSSRTGKSYPKKDFGKDDFSKDSRTDSKPSSRTGKSYPKKDFGKDDFSKDSRTDSKPSSRTGKSYPKKDFGKDDFSKDSKPSSRAGSKNASSFKGKTGQKPTNFKGKTPRPKK
jgi:GTP-binding protein